MRESLTSAPKKAPYETQKQLDCLKVEISGGPERFQSHPSILKLQEVDGGWGTAFAYEYRGLKMILATDHQGVKLGMKGRLISETHGDLGEYKGFLLGGNTRTHILVTKDDFDIPVLSHEREEVGSVTVLGYPSETLELENGKICYVFPKEKTSKFMKSKGVITQKTGRMLNDFTTMFQTDFLNRGYSGGPILSDAGKVVGINESVIFGDATKPVKSKGFFIPIGNVNAALDIILEVGGIQYGKTGIQDAFYRYAEMKETEQRKAKEESSLSYLTQKIREEFNKGNYEAVGTIVEKSLKNPNLKDLILFGLNPFIIRIVLGCLNRKDLYPQITNLEKERDILAIEFDRIAGYSWEIFYKLCKITREKTFSDKDVQKITQSIQDQEIRKIAEKLFSKVKK